MNPVSDKHTNKFLWPLQVCLAITFLAAGFAPWAAGQSPPPPTQSEQSDDGPANWPREFDSGSTHFTIYQPQLDFWDGHSLTARAAVAVKEESEKNEAFGSISIGARTGVDKTTRIVTIDQVSVSKLKFPTKAEEIPGYEKALNDNLHGVVRTMALDRLQAQLEILHAVETADALPLKHVPPALIFATGPSILVTIDGDAVFKPVPSSQMERVINTRVLLLRDSNGQLYLHLFDGWMTASGLNAEWSVDKEPLITLSQAKEIVLKTRKIDLLQGGGADSGNGSADSAPTDDGQQAQPQKPPSLNDGPAPRIYLVNKPTELIVTDGEPSYVPIEGTNLLYVKNTSADIFKEIDTQQSLIRVSGRWFDAASLDGPWTFVEGKNLPADFAKIPDDSDKGNVKASVPGTAQAQEALIANSIPQTAAVNIDDAKFSQPQYDGDPQFEPIEETELYYAINASAPVIEVSETAFYSVENGVWFTAASATGPWQVATSVPPVIYTIPVSSPLHYVTYVYIYEVTDDVVYVGYTPGYSGTVVYQDIVVYGTGYYYYPWIGSYWWGWPVTYGYGAGLYWSSWGGWGFGFGYGWGRGWGAHPYWGPWYGGYHGGYRGWGARYRGRALGNYYQRWGRAANTGIRGERARAAGLNSRTGSNTARSNNVFADHNGNVYRRQDSGQWQQHSAGNWKNMQGEGSSFSRDRATAGEFGGANRNFGSTGYRGTGFQSRGFNAGAAHSARMSGMARSSSFRSAGGFRGGGRRR